jgi:hypothetical protein
MNQAIQQLVHAAFTGNVKLVRKILSDKNQKVDVNAANGNFLIERIRLDIT